GVVAQRGVPAAPEEHGHAEDAVVLRSIGRRGMSYVNLLEERLVARHSPPCANHPRETRFRELREVVGILAAIDDPDLPVAALEGETIARPDAVDFDRQGRVP